MNNEICGQLTKSGKPCRFARGECKWHRRAEREPRPAVEAAVVTPAFEGHDARGLAWWTVDSLLRGELPASNASVIASLLRVIAGLGPDPVSEEEALAETAFRGRIMHGLPPRDAAE